MTMKGEETKEYEKRIENVKMKGKETREYEKGVENVKMKGEETKKGAYAKKLEVAD